MSHTQNTHKKLWFINGDESARYAQVPVQLLLDSRLAPRHLHIMTVLILHANRETGVCKISRETLIDYTGYNITTISKATKALVEFGWLDKSRQWSNANVYRVMLPKFAAGELREIQNRRVPDDVWAAQQAEVLARQERFRIERREEHAADLAEVGAALVEGAVSEFECPAVTTDAQPVVPASANQPEIAVEIASVVPPVAMPRNRVFVPAVKPRSRVVAALREYLETQIEDPEISEKDLNFYDFRWGDDPDYSPAYSISDEVVEAGDDIEAQFLDIHEYEVAADFA